MIWNKWLPKFGILAFGLWLLSIYGFDKAAGAEWKLFQTTPTGDIYCYDSTNIKRFPNGVVWVWARIIETTGLSEEKLKGLKDPKKAKEVIKEAREKSTGEWKDLFEIHCSAGIVRILSATSYDTQGNIRDDYETPSEWVNISPNSITNYLTKIVCP
jgi:GTPase SAR1 family protein